MKSHQNSLTNFPHQNYIYLLTSIIYMILFLNSFIIINVFKNKKTLDLSQLNGGSYILKIEANEKIGTKKIILQK